MAADIKTVQALAERAEWLADKLAGNDYVQEAAQLLRKFALIAQMQREAVQPADVEELRLGLGQIAVRVRDDSTMVRCCRLVDEFLALAAAPHPEAQALDAVDKSPDMQGRPVDKAPEMQGAHVFNCWQCGAPDPYAASEAQALDSQLQQPGLQSPCTACGLPVPEDWSCPVCQQQDDHAGSPAPSAQFDDPRVQSVYAILCADEQPPEGEHWEGFAARRIVDALAAESSKAALSDDEIATTARELFCRAMGDKEGDWGPNTLNAHWLEQIGLPFARAILARAGIGESRREPLTDERIVAIVREASLGAATRRDGTTSTRIARGVEAAHGITPQAGKESGE